MKERRKAEGRWKKKPHLAVHRPRQNKPGEGSRGVGWPKHHDVECHPEPGWHFRAEQPSACPCCRGSLTGAYEQCIACTHTSVRKNTDNRFIVRNKYRLTT